MYQPNAVWRPANSQTRWTSAGANPTLSLTYFMLHPFFFLLFAPFIRVLLSCSAKNQKFKESCDRPPRPPRPSDQAARLPSPGQRSKRVCVWFPLLKIKGICSFRVGSETLAVVPAPFVFSEMVTVAEAIIVPSTTASECAHVSSRLAYYDGGEA